MMFGRKVKRLAVFLAAMGLSFGLGAAGAQAADTIKIAVPSPYTGSAAGFGENVKAGVAMKVA